MKMRGFLLGLFLGVTSTLNAAYYTNTKVDDIDYIEAADLEAIETGFANVETDIGTLSDDEFSGGIAVDGATKDSNYGLVSPTSIGLGTIFDYVTYYPNFGITINDDAMIWHDGDGLVLGDNVYWGWDGTAPTLDERTFNAGAGSALRLLNGGIYLQTGTTIADEAAITLSTRMSIDATELYTSEPVRIDGGGGAALMTWCNTDTGCTSGNGTVAFAETSGGDFFIRNTEAGQLVLGAGNSDYFYLEENGTLGEVGINMPTPDGTLHVYQGSAGSVTASTVINEIVIEDDADAGISILTPAANSGTIYFGDVNDNDVASITHDHSADEMTVNITSGSDTNVQLSNSGAGVMDLFLEGSLLLGNTAAAPDFEISFEESTSVANNTQYDFSIPVYTYHFCALIGGNSVQSSASFVSTAGAQVGGAVGSAVSLGGSSDPATASAVSFWVSGGAFHIYNRLGVAGQWGLVCVGRS